LSHACLFIILWMIQCHVYLLLTVFSGFGGARPRSTAAPTRQRRNITTTATSARPSAPATAPSKQPTAPAPKPTTAPKTSAPASKSTPASTGAAEASSRPPGPAQPSSVALWQQWLGLNPRSGADTPLMPLATQAHEASTTRMSNHWKLVNGYWVSGKTGKLHERHPLLGHFLNKLDSRRLAIKFNVGMDEEEDEESMVESGEEDNKGQRSPSSTSRNFLNQSMDDSFNDLLSPASPTLKPTASKGHASTHVKASSTASSTAVPSSSLAVNTQSNTPLAGASNLTPSPYQYTQQHRPAPSSDSVAAAKSTSTQQLASVPENASGGRASDLAATQLRIAPGSDGMVLLELQEKVRLQSIRIEELESQKRSLHNELHAADEQHAELMRHARAKADAAILDAERRSHAQVEALKMEMAKGEARYRAQLAEQEEKIRGMELRRVNAVAEAVQAAETKARESLDQALRLAAAQAETDKQLFARELDNLRTLHANELASLRQQQHDSSFLRALVSKVESQASNLENLSKKVYSERSASERMTLEQLNVREQLLREKEASLEVERKQNETLATTFARLRSEQAEERARLAQEHARLTSLQNDLHSESALLREQLTAEREQLRKERTALAAQRESFAQQQARETKDIADKQEAVTRAHAQLMDSIEEAQKERLEAMLRIEEEREEIRTEKRQLANRRADLDAREEALRNDEAEFSQHVAAYESRLSELTELGTKVKAQSEEVAAQYNKIHEERKLAESAKREAQEMIEQIQKEKAATEATLGQLKAEKKGHERQKSQLLQLQNKVMLDKDLAMREISVTKSIHGYSSSPMLPTQSPATAVTGAGTGTGMSSGALTPPIRMQSFDFGLASSPSLSHMTSPSFSLISPFPHLPSSSSSSSFSSSSPPVPVPVNVTHLGATLADLTERADKVRTFMTEEKIMSHDDIGEHQQRLRIP